MRPRAFFDTLPLPVVGVDRERRVTLWNAAAARLLGWPAAEVVGQPDPSVPPEVAAEHKTMWNAAFRGEFAARRESSRINRAGETLDVEITSTILLATRDEGETALMILYDVSERQATEKCLAERESRSHEQLRRLSAKMNKIEEDERRRIAREMHDELGQLLTALRLDISIMRRDLRTVPTATLEERMRTMVDLVDLTIKTVRRVATELRPAILDDFGLRAAVEHEVAAFAERTGIGVKLAIRNENAVGPDCATALYRIVQEALTNVARHSGATRVEVRIEGSDERVEAEFRDNGRGITEAEVNGLSTLGLVGVRERAYALGGEAVIEALPGAGTRILVSIPLKVTEAIRR